MSLPIWLTNPTTEIYHGNYVVLDFETTNLDKGNAVNKDNKLLLGCWKRSDSHTHKEHWGNEYEYDELIQDLYWADFFVAHNAKFELKWSARAGADLTKLLPFDTQIAEYVISGNRGWKTALGAVSERRGFGSKEPYVDLCMKGGVCPSELPRSMLAKRCGMDIYQTEEIFLQQLDEMEKAGLLPAFHTRCMFTPVLADMEMQGMHVDGDRIKAEFNNLSYKAAELAQKLEDFTGGINPRSVPQMREYLYEVLKFKPLKVRGKEVLGTDQDTMAKLKAKTKKQKQFLELKKEFGKVNALLTKSIMFLYGVHKERGDIFHAQFNQCVTKTHRLSSSGLPIKFELYQGKSKSMQFQNFPRIYKGMFTARNEQWYMGEIDGAQLEFRVAAFLGKDKQAKEDIRNGTDIHSFTANTITEAGQETTRQEAKVHTFKPLYGGSSGTKAEQAYYEAFKTKYSGVASEQQAWLDEVVRTKCLRLASGLILYWPTTVLQASGYITNREQICNAPVQSLATAEMMPIAITYMWHRMKMAEMESFLVNTIHDSAIAEIHPDERELFTEVGVQAFTTDSYEYFKVMYDLDWDVPMGAGIKMGKHWGEGAEPIVIDESRLPEGCTYKVDGSEVTYTVD